MNPPKAAKKILLIEDDPAPNPRIIGRLISKFIWRGVAWRLTFSLIPNLSIDLKRGETRRCFYRL